MDIVKGSDGCGISSSSGVDIVHGYGDVAVARFPRDSEIVADLKLICES